MKGRFTGVLAGLLGRSEGVLPAARREWAEALLAEAGEVPAGAARLAWLGGGLWLVAREANMVRKFVYWLGIGAVAAAAAWVAWLSWRAYPAADPLTVTDRVRVGVGAAALIVLPWVGRRRGWFGPVGGTITARLVRVAGCVAVCGLGVAVVRMDSHLFAGPHGPGPFSLPREIAALVVLGTALAVLAVVKAVCGLLLTNFFALAGVVMMVIGPLAGLGGGATGAAIAADHPREARPDRSWAAGLFVLRS